MTGLRMLEAEGMTSKASLSLLLDPRSRRNALSCCVNDENLQSPAHHFAFHHRHVVMVTVERCVHKVRQPDSDRTMLMLTPNYCPCKPFSSDVLVWIPTFVTRKPMTCAKKVDVVAVVDTSCERAWRKFPRWQPRLNDKKAHFSSSVRISCHSMIM